MSDSIQFIYDGEPFRAKAGGVLLTALEEAGVRLVRGVGCRGGVCGACTIFYRKRGEYELSVGLLCQEMVKDGMEIMPMPYFPQKKADYRLDLPEGDTPHFRVVNLYPEVNRCIMCAECSRNCPVGIDVMGYVGMIKRGDLKAASRESFICIQCQACVARCPAQISQPNAALAARRFHGRHEMRPAEHLAKAVERMEAAIYDRGFRRLRKMDKDELVNLYQAREKEPGDAPPGTWMPEDVSLLPLE